MKITVLNGSPKGDTSVTIQYINYIQKICPEQSLEIIDISKNIKKIENDADLFKKIIKSIDSSDGIIWSTPVFYFLIPAQMKRFIELIFERDAARAFKGKYTIAITTSIQFFDHTAHNYLRAICDDLKMRYIDFFSAKMYDLIHKKMRNTFTIFINNFFNAIQKKKETYVEYKPLNYRVSKYTPRKIKRCIDAGSEKVLIVTDCRDNKSNLYKMTEVFQKSFIQEIEIINLHNINIKGGCLDCIKCSTDNQCTYGKSDDFYEFFTSKIKKADVLLFAGSIKDRYLSSRWKYFFDRSFFNNHVPYLSGKQIGYIISGPLSDLPNLKQILESYCQIVGANPVGFISDDNATSKSIDLLIQNLAHDLITCSQKKYIKPHTFLGIGGKKIFRDEIWGDLRFVFQADHRYYKKHKLYNFPQKNYGTRIFNLLIIPLLKIPFIQKKFYDRILKEMIRPFRNILEK